MQDHGNAGRDIVFDVDPEVVRKGVRSLMQQVAQIERERVNVIQFCIVSLNNLIITLLEIYFILTLGRLLH